MNTTELLREILTKIFRKKMLIILLGIVCAVLLYIDAKITKPTYTSKATVFPLTNATDNALSSGTLSGLLGITDAPKSFSGDASINIIELALSRNIREAVASAKILGEWGNKTVAELLIEEHNKTFSFFDKKIELPNDSVSLAVEGSKLLFPIISARLNRNGVLELNFTTTNEKLVTPVSELIISKISQFYIDLRIEKATVDYNFTLKKIDSLQKVMDSLDSKAIQMQGSTLFTPADKLVYSIPKENLGDEKLRVSHERDISINNREEALWRLQKITPIVATLDKPTPPFDVTKPSGVIYAIVGFILGTILAMLVLISGLIYRYVKGEIYKSIFGDHINSPQPAPVVNS